MAVKAYALEHHALHVVIVGAGGSGLRAAIACAQAGLKTAVITKVPPIRSHTAAAQGGINAALGNAGPDDWRWHAYDTVRGSDWLGDQDAIAMMCEAAPKAVLELEHMGMAFTRDVDGKMFQRAYGGQATEFGKGTFARRACAVDDRTGHALLHTLYQQALKAGVKFHVEFVALDLVMENGACKGVLAWELETGKLHSFAAHATVVATGGYGQAWASTTSSSICTGDGGGMALRAGIALQDMEFVQFHPTGLYGTGILISEAARGEGAILTNASGERFMERYAPHYKDLASRDIIAHAIMCEIAEGRGCGEKRDHVYLSLAHLDASSLERLPAIRDIVKRFANKDITYDPIPVLPAVHYTMGGIPTNAHSETPVPGLYALGEAACASIHGANRLGCNGLLELVVFGRALGPHLKPLAKHSPPSMLTADNLALPIEHFNRIRQMRGNASPAAIRKSLQQAMQQYAGIIRGVHSLIEGERALEQVWKNFRDDLNVGDNSLIWNTGLTEALEVENLLLQSIATMAAARQRDESRGAHFREDFPERDDARWLCHSLVSVDVNAHTHPATAPVRLDANHPDMESFPPEARHY